MGDHPEQKFEWALKNGDMDQVKSIVEKDKLAGNKALPSGRYPLCVAADYGQTDVIRYLVDNGADVNVKDCNGMTPLLSAIYEGHVECVRVLLEKGASKSEKAPNGDTYLQCAESEEIKNLLK